jgi:hypothetical protein
MTVTLMSTSPKDIPLSHDAPTTTGKDRWTRSVEIERVMIGLRGLAVSASYRGNANVPTAGEFEMWAKDLRRGRASIVGSVVRFVRLVEQREMGEEGRRIALEAYRLIGEYIDLALPASASQKAPQSHVVQYNKLARRRA